jgi:glycosyltransferase domain-containing protein
LTDLADKLTVIVPLKGRGAYTRRWLRHGRLGEFPFHVVLADGSETRETSDRFDTSEFVRGVEHVKYPPDTCLDDYLAKMLDALRKVKTPYVVLCANDDLLLPRGVLRSVEFLELNGDYAAARGEIFPFLIRPVPDAVARGVYGPTVVFKSDYWQQRSIVGRRALSRVAEQLSGYCSAWHDVARTDFAIERFAAVVEASPGDIRFADQFNDILAPIQGKIKRGPWLYMLQQVGMDDSHGNQVIGDYPTWFSWIRTEWWRATYDRLSRVAGKMLALRDGIPLGEATREFDRIYEREFLHKRMLEDFKRIAPGGTVAAASSGSAAVTALKRLKDKLRIAFSGHAGEIGQVAEFLENAQDEQLLTTP